MKKCLLFLVVVISLKSNAQKLDSIFVNLYTDSLKLGTFNYINVDGLFANGSYQPLDSTTLTFTSSHGIFYGNNLWLDSSLTEEKIAIKVFVKEDKKKCKDFEMFIKKTPDPPLLMTNEEYLQFLKKEKKKKKTKLT